MGNMYKIFSQQNLLLRPGGKPFFIAGAGILLVVIFSGLIAFNLYLGVGCALAVLLLALVIPRPYLIAYGLIIIIPLTAGLSRGAVIPLLRVGQALLIVGFLLFLLSKSPQLGKGRLSIIDLAFALFFLSEAVFPLLALYYRGEHLDLSANNIFKVSPLQTLLGPIQYYLLYRIVVAVLSSEKQLVTALKLSFVTSMAVSAIGIMEKAFPAFRTLVELYYPPIASSYTIADSETRIASTLQHYSGLGAYLAFTIILVLVCCVAPKRLNFSPWFLIITLLLNSMALILTGTFATLIGLAVGMAIIFLVLRRIPRLVVLTLIGSVLAIFLFQSFISSRLNQELGAGAMQGLVPQSFAFRITLWQQIFLPAVSKYFLFGAGPAPTVLNNWPSEETQYLYLLLRGGLLYFLSYFLLMGIGFFLCWRQI